MQNPPSHPKANPLAEIDVFIDSIYRLACNEVARIDPRFTSALKSRIRLDALGLESAFPTPTRATHKLNASWHMLLEACIEFQTTLDCVVVAARLASEPVGTKTPAAHGREYVYHFRSWFAHALALTERSNALMDRTVEVFVQNTADRTRLKRQYHQRTDETSKLVENQRNNYFHGYRRSWASGLTEEQLWETAAVVKMLPKQLLEDFVYPSQMDPTRKFKPEFFRVVTDDMTKHLGKMLNDLASDLGLDAASANLSHP